MAFKATFCTFDKRVNSLLQLENEAAIELVDNLVSLDCVLKNPASIMRPVLMIDLDQIKDDSGDYTVNFMRWNYCKIETFERYYFITNMVSDHGLWIIELKEDCLGTFYSKIIEQECMIERCENMRDEYLADAIYPTKAKEYNIISNMWGATGSGEATDPYKHNSYVTTLTSNPANSGCIIIGVLNSTSGTLPVTYYILTLNQFNDLKSMLFNTALFNDGNMEISNDLLKVLFNPYQYIASCFYVPFTLESFSGTYITENINFGWWIPQAGTIQGQRIFNYKSRHFMGSFDVAKNPDAGPPDTIEDDAQIIHANSRGQYLNFAPFTRYYCYFEPFGYFEMDNAIMGQFLSQQIISFIKAYIDFDAITGNGVLSFKYRKYDPLTDTLTDEVLPLPPIYGQVGVPVQIGQITSDIYKGALHVLTNVANPSILTHPISWATNAVSSIYDGMQIAAPQLEKMGNNGNFTILSNDCYIRSIVMRQTENNPKEHGYPLMKIKTISDCYGFFKTHKFNNRIEGTTLDEYEEICSYLNSGVYNEVGD